MWRKNLSRSGLSRDLSYSFRLSVMKWIHIGGYDVSQWLFSIPIRFWIQISIDSYRWTHIYIRRIGRCDCMQCLMVVKHFDIKFWSFVDLRRSFSQQLLADFWASEAPRRLLHSQIRWLSHFLVIRLSLSSLPPSTPLTLCSSPTNVRNCANTHDKGRAQSSLLHLHDKMYHDRTVLAQLAR